VLNVFVADWDSVQVPFRTVAHDPRLGGARVSQRALLGHQQEAVHTGIDARDTRQAFLREFDR
jgi:hypothetical protein